MSKIYDVEKMYGQDFGIVTTNAPSNIIKQAKKLLPNTFLISSPQNENGEDSDNNLPSIFVTDYNAQPLRLTYPFYMKNGLNYSDEYGYAFINIDNSTIKTENLDGSGKLKVNTENLSNATFNKKGVVKLSEQLTDINRNLKTDYNLQDSISGKYNNSTFITVNNDGILYLNNDLLDLINNLVDLKIKQKIDSIKIMLNSNLKMWIEITAINGNTYVNNIHNVGSLTDAYTIDNNTPTSLTFNLHYLSFSDASESVQIIDTSNKIYSIVFEGENPDEKHLTMVKSLENNDELYEHVINNISIIFLPNYFIENNENYKQEIPLVFEIDNDKSETLLIQQDRLSNYGIVIDVNGDKELRVNEILNIAVESGIDETIQLNGFANEIKLDGENIIKYQIDTFIVNTYDESNNYELSTIDDYKNTGEISITNLSDKNKSKLYHFIEGIIDQNDSEEDENSNDQYYIDTSKTIRNNGQDILISDFVEQLINDSVIKYYIKFGTNLKILTTNNKEIGSYNKVIEVQLNLDKKTIYGYIFITGTNINGKDESYPVHMYYPNRVKTNNSEQRVYLNNKTQYEPKNIDTEKLYGIYGDFNINSGFNIPYTSFNIYNTKNVSESNNGITSINDPQTDVTCSMEDSGDATFAIENNPENDRKIHISSNNHYTNLLKLFYDGFTFNINYSQSNESSIIKKQFVKLNINLLEILLTNTEFGRISDNSWIRDFKINNTNIPNTSNYNSSDYYNMDNYVLTGYNNNQVRNIKVSLPECVKSILSLNQSNKFYIHLYFYVNSNNNSDVQKVSIVFNKQPNGKIAGSLVTNNNSSNLINPSDIIDTIDDQLIDNSYIIKSKSDFLPKLLMISYSINEQNEKICYIQNTYSCNGGEIIQSDNSSILTQKLYTITNNTQTLYDIIGVSNVIPILANESEDFIKLLLKKYIDNQPTNILIKSLDLSGLLLEFNEGGNNTSNNIFKLMINNKDEYFKGSINQIYIAKFKYNYLSNPNDKLDDYNYYSGTSIDGGDKITNAGYQIRFNQVILTLNESNKQLGESGYYLYGNNIYINNSSNKLTIYHINTDNIDISNYTINTVFGNIFKVFQINNSSIVDFTNIKLENLNNLNITNIVPNTEYRLLLNNYTLNGNTVINNLSLGYSIVYYNVSWQGLRLSNSGGYIKDQILLTYETYNSIFTNLVVEPITLQSGDTYQVIFKTNDTQATEKTLDEIHTDVNNKYNNGIISDFTFEYNVYWKRNANMEIPLLSQPLKFILQSNTSYSNIPDSALSIVDKNGTAISDIIINNENTNDIRFKIQYNSNIITQINVEQKDINNLYQSDAPFIEVSNSTSGDTTTYVYKLNGQLSNGNYHNETYYNIIINATGNTLGNPQYSNRTYIKTAFIKIVQRGEYSDFYWDGPAIQTPITEINPSSWEDKLHSLHLPNDINPSQINYTISVEEYSNELTTLEEAQSFISTNNNQMCFVSGQKNMTISETAKGKGEIKYKITATLEADNNSPYITTSRESYFLIDIT